MHCQLVWSAVVLLAASFTEACPEHNYKPRSIPLNTLKGPHVRRQDLGNLYRRAESGPRDWNYTASESWASIKAGMILST